MKYRDKKEINYYRPQYNGGSRGKHHKKNQKKKLNKKKLIMVILIPVLIVVIIKINNRKEIETSQNESKEPEEVLTNSITTTDTEKELENNENENNIKNKIEITDWRLTLANYDNILPEDFEVELADIDSTRQFDARAISYLKNMINDMKKAGNTNIWCQSAFRSIKRQKELYDASIEKYLKQGKSEKEAEELTLEYINRPGGSDHNLGLAVDFNYVDNSFAKTSEYKWLLKNAENYGFILRYPEDKEDITKIAYESWHWRYVGEEHAKRMNELNMCLEEYVEYLQNGNR